jgi:FkbM family methyltransferase
MKNKFTTLIEEALKHSAPSLTFNNERILIYGAGGFSRWLINNLRLDQGYRISAILDVNAKTGEHIRGIPVLAPNEWLNKNTPSDSVVLIAISNPDINIASIQNILKSNGFLHVLNIQEFYEAFPSIFPDPWLWMTRKIHYAYYSVYLDRLNAILADETSCIWLESVVRFRLTGERTQIALPPTLDDQYHPHGLPAWNNHLRFIDCGAFDGDTLRDFEKHGYRFEAIAAFEPDPDNFQNLSRTAARYENTVCFPCAVGANTEIVNFNATADTSSHVFAGKGVPVQCVRLDEALPTFAPNLIKMDIEGAEPDALLGARSTITKYRPGLAICLYHAPEHLWQIPLLIHEWNLDYRFYIRGHAHFLMELVLYAIPAEHFGNAHE